MVYGVHLQRDISGAFSFSLDVPLQDSPEITTLITSDKVKEYPTAEIL